MTHLWRETHAARVASKLEERTRGYGMDRSLIVHACWPGRTRPGNVRHRVFRREVGDPA